MDHGWGCSYRNAQTVAAAMGKAVPSMKDLLGVFDLQKVAPGRKRWIERYRSAFCCESSATSTAPTSCTRATASKTLRSAACSAPRSETTARTTGSRPTAPALWPASSGISASQRLPGRDRRRVLLVRALAPQRRRRLHPRGPLTFPRSTRADHIRRITGRRAAAYHGMDGAAASKAWGKYYDLLIHAILGGKRLKAWAGTPDHAISMMGAPTGVNAKMLAMRPISDATITTIDTPALADAQMSATAALWVI